MSDPDLISVAIKLRRRVAAYRADCDLGQRVAYSPEEFEERFREYLLLEKPDTVLPEEARLIETMLIVIDAMSPRRACPLCTGDPAGPEDELCERCKADLYDDSCHEVEEDEDDG